MLQFMLVVAAAFVAAYVLYVFLSHRDEEHGGHDPHQHGEQDESQEVAREAT